MLLLLLFCFTDFTRLIRFCLFKFIYRNELWKVKEYFPFVLSFIILTYRAWKNSDYYFTGLGWLYDILDLDLKNTQTTLRDSAWFFNILDLKSARTNFTEVRLTLWYSGLGLKKYLDCLAGLVLILLYIRFGLWIDKMN